MIPIMVILLSFAFGSVELAWAQGDSDGLPDIFLPGLDNPGGQEGSGGNGGTQGDLSEFLVPGASGKPLLHADDVALHFVIDGIFEVASENLFDFDLRKDEDAKIIATQVMMGDLTGVTVDNLETVDPNELDVVHATHVHCGDIDLAELIHAAFCTGPEHQEIDQVAVLQIEADASGLVVRKTAIIINRLSCETDENLEINLELKFLQP